MPNTQRPLLTIALGLIAFGCSKTAPPGAAPIERPPSDGTSSGTLPDGGAPPQVNVDPCRGSPLPEQAHFVTGGLCARVVGPVLRGLRHISFAPNGDLFAVTQPGAIYKLRDADGSGTFEASEVVEYANTGGNGNNCDIDGGFVYAGSRDGVKRFSYTPDSASGGAGEDVVVGQPTGGHGVHSVHVYDGFLYVSSGSASNATNPRSPEYDDARSLVRRFDLSKPVPFSWLSGEIVTVGLRNMNGFARSAAGRIFGVVNGLDEQRYAGEDVHNDNPGEQIVEVASNKAYGYPFCFTAQRIVQGGGVIAAGTQLANPGFPVHDDAWCSTHSSPPATFIQAHSAPLDIAFFDVQPGGSLHERWRGGAFVSLHGSWNRAPATGYKVIWLPFDKAGAPSMPTSTATATTFPYETVFGGGDVTTPRDGPWSYQAASGGTVYPRPVGVAISPVDGALYVSSDSDGRVYRVGLKR